MNHEHQHDHSHGASGNVLLWALGITLAFALVEALGGWLSGSLALLGDAGHMVSDATALGLAALAAWITKRPPSKRHSYGLGRAEVIAALVNSIAMLAIVVAIVAAAVDRFRDPRPVAAATVIAVALVGLVVNMVVAWVLSRGEETLNIRGALLHVMGDLLGSVAALVAGVVILFTGWTPIDPILSVLICVLILVSALRLLREGLHVIMEGVPAGMDLNQVGTTMARASGVKSVHDLHIWTLSSGNVALSAHVVIEGLDSWDEILGNLRRTLHDHYGIEHVTIQPETTLQIVRPSDIRQRLSQ